ncbi:zinc-dependent metalloprotease [Butyricimonas sp.]|uniref:zinc-dependent metalloprotease n=1 Tax=Butyricimonas sp. TaxID=1969738 RepID=UPI0025BAE1B9|nr:zinc-dependent metalloprotease [Butyricimonas sp.]
MNRFYYILLLLCLPWMAFAQEKATPAPAAKSKAPLTYEAFFKNGMRKIEGTFSVYQSDKKCYLEIPAELLEKDLMSSGIISKGPWSGTASVKTDLLVFTLGRNDRLEVRKQLCRDRAEGAMAGAVEASALEPVDYFYPIAAYGKDKKSYIIDITADVNATGKLFAFPNLQWVNRPVADRSGLDSVYVINNGMKFMSLHTQTDYMPPMMPGQMGYDKHNSVMIEWTLQALPERQVCDREADARVGYLSLSFNDFDRNPYKAEAVYVVRRWNLEIRPEDTERYKRGELVEPKMPIAVYFDRSVDPASRVAVVRAIEEWNGCFEQAGFKNVLQVREGGPEAYFAYHQISFSRALFTRKVNTVTNPRTGEILCANISIGNSDIRDYLLRAFVGLGAYEPAVFTDSLPAVQGEVARYVTSKYLGEILGLVPNMAGSMAYTTAQLRDAAWVKEHGISASVTDGCGVNYAVQPGDNIPLRDLFSKASDYDRWAIEWGYRQYPGLDVQAEKKALKVMAEKAKDNTLLCFIPEGRKGYKSNRFDLAQDKLAAAELGIKNLERLIPAVEGIAGRLDKDDSWQMYSELTLMIYAAYINYVALALDYIGSVTPEAVIAGYNEQPLNFASKAQQEEAMRFIEKYVFAGAPSWMNNSLMEQVSGFEEREPMTNVLTRIFGKLNGPETLAYLLLTEKKLGDKGYTYGDMMKVIDRNVFLNFSTTKKVTSYTALAQMIYLKSLIKLYTGAKVAVYPGDLSYSLINRMSHLVKSIERLGRTHGDAATRQHYHGVAIYLKRALLPQEQAGVPVR